MKPPVARKLAGADARRVAAARAARAAAASTRAAAAKRRMVLVSALGALALSGWVLTVMMNLTWIIPAVLTAATITVVELGRRAAAAGARADAELAKRVRIAEARANRGLSRNASGKGSSQAAKDQAAKDRAAQAGAEGVADFGEAGVSSLRVEVDPAKAEAKTWTPVPVPPPAYTLKAEVRRKLPEESASPAEVPAAAPAPAPSGAPAPAVVSTPESGEETGSLNVQEILARRRAVG